MIRKLIKAVITFSVLSAGYVAYDHGFGILAGYMGAAVPRTSVPRLNAAVEPTTDADPSAPPSVSKQRALELARMAFGDGHWATNPDLTILYYNEESGYWVYAGDYKRQPDGYRVEFFPFAVVWESKDRRGFKAISGEHAYADFEEKFDPFKPSSKPARIRNAKIEDEVVIRDWRDGGRSDLTIGPLAYLEYDQKERVIRSENTPITIRDRDLMITCVGLRVDLLPATPGPAKPGTPSVVSGFGGVERVRLDRDVRIVHDNIGSTGFLAGASPPPGKSGQDERIPFELTCAGQADFELPPPQPTPPPGVAPPAPLPTIARFDRNVQLKRGQPIPDALDCDNLVVKLYPVDKPAPETPPEDEDGSGLGSALEIRDARASGHAVWLQSPAQGLKALGNELIYRRQGTAEQPNDETYFSANRGTGLRIEKIDQIREGPDAGKINAYTTIDTIDATIVQTGTGPARLMTIVARGPGRLESRPDKDQPAQRVATWQDLLRLKTYADDRRLLVLTGSPSFQDVAQARITSRDTLQVAMRPRPASSEGTGAIHSSPVASTPAASGQNSIVIDWVRAENDVHLTAYASPRPLGSPPPDEDEPGMRRLWARNRLDVLFDPPPPNSGGKGGGLAGTAPTPAAAAAPSAVPTQVVDAPPLIEEDGPAATVAQAPAKPTEPSIDVVADTVWARAANAGPDSKMEIREARLRGTVEVHRGPAANEQSGSDVAADKVDLTGQGENRFLVRAHGTPEKPALVVSDSFKIEGPRLAVDQTANTAEVDGPGELTQWVKGREAEMPGGVPALVEAEPHANRRPMVVSWKSGMQFDGQPTSTEGKPLPGHARFVSGVVATIDEARIVGEQLDVYLDQPISLSGTAMKKDGDQARPQLSFVHALNDVEISNAKRDPRTGLLLEYDRINGQRVTYWAPGGFQVDGAGIVRVYSRAGAEAGLNPSAGRRTPPQTASGKVAPLQLTRVEFRQAMLGRFLGPAENPADGERIGQFWGDVKVLHAKVADEKTDITEDRAHPPDDMVALHSQYLWVDNLPGQGEQKQADSSRTRLLARGNGQAALARTYGPNASTIEGDRITYHTDTAQFLVVGENGRDVVIARSNGLGQPVSPTDARQVLYNSRTGDTRVVDPGVISLFEPKTGIGTGFAAAPNRQPDPIKPFEMPARMGDKGTKERRSFNGTTR